MNEQFQKQIIAKARKFATAYTNRHLPNEPAFAFGHEGWEKFVDALVELAGAHPDKDTSALPFPVRIMDQLQEIARREDSEHHGPWTDGDGEPLQDDADAAIAWIKAATPVVPAPVALDGAHSDQVALLLSKVRVAACVIENLPELPGYNGSILTIDDTEAARISKELYEIAEFLDKPQAAPVVQLSEPPEGESK